MPIFNDGRPFLGRNSYDVGLSRKLLNKALAELRIRRIFDGVFVDSSIADSRELRIEALRLVAPDHAVACDSTAAWLHGVETFRPSERHTFVPSLVVPHGLSRTTLPGARCPQAYINPSDVTEIGGVLVTTPLRTTSDLLRKMWRPYALAAADSMAHAGLIDVVELWDYLARLKGYRGIVQARSLGYVVEPLTGSPGESWTRLRLLDAGFPRPEPQYEISDGGGVIRAFDLAYSEKLAAIEYDGRGFHSLDKDVAHDERRRAYFRDVLGWVFFVPRYEDIFGSDCTFEISVGDHIGMRPQLPRQW
ncbi:MAG: hypothetical protein JWP10_837 [Nocardioidaceae bacterium]|nr:hypothetical protein [Nocardioidaceae bacterium]